MAAADNPSREAILSRIKSALTSSAPVPEPPHNTALFPAVGDLSERFREECAANLVECVATSSAQESADALATVLASLPEGGIFLEDSPELLRLNSTPTGRVGRDIQWSSAGRPTESGQVTVTTAECLIAATGSIVVSSSRGGRCGSVAAPCHVVYARTDQLVPDLDAAMARLYAIDAPDRNSLVGLVTGSSRTADIEKILVLGAHGPRRVVVILERA
jgi:L-lactate dehydrogenase complex protein LldG